MSPVREELCGVGHLRRQSRANLQYVTDANKSQPGLLNSNDVSACNGATPASIAANPALARVHIRRWRPWWLKLQRISTTIRATRRAEALSYGLTSMSTMPGRICWMTRTRRMGQHRRATGLQIGNNPPLTTATRNFDIPQRSKEPRYTNCRLGMASPYEPECYPRRCAWRMAHIGDVYLPGRHSRSRCDTCNDYSQAGNVFCQPTGTSPTQAPAPMARRYTP